MQVRVNENFSGTSPSLNGQPFARDFGEEIEGHVNEPICSIAVDNVRHRVGP